MNDRVNDRVNAAGDTQSASRDYDRAIAVFAALREMEPAARREALAKEPPGVAELLRRMLDSDVRDTRATDLARGDLLDVASDLLTTDNSELVGAPAPIPPQIGPYRITGILGEGGMGMVFDGREEHPDRRVAVKVLRSFGLASSSAGSKELAARFQREVAVVGRLHHHGIAKVYQAGTFVEGRERVPYFAMEFVDGPTLDRFLQVERPAREVVLDLLARVCDAVDYAHQQGVVHRDLKPRNIVVQRLSREGSEALWPKVLDFGVARVVSSDAGATIATTAGQIVGTLAYMSPEQLVGRPDIDARADVYSLGVILVEALTGQLPFGRAPASIVDAAKMVEQEQPRALGSLKPGRWGDLEVIVRTALAREPSRRYSSAAALAEDLRRFARLEPILARKPSAAYLFATFARRNKALVSIVGAAIAGLAALAGVALYQARVAERARAIAANQRDKAEAVSDFMVKDLFNTYRFAREGPKTPVVALLQGADESARERFKDKPDVRYALEYSLASMYGQMGLTDKSLELVERANDTIRQVYPEGHSERRAIQSMYYAGLVELGRGAEVLDAISKAIAESDRIEGTHSITSMYMRIALAKHGLMTGDLDAADKALGEILDGQLPDEALRTAEYGQALNLRTALYLGTDRPKQAMEYIERSKVFTDQDAFRHGHDWLAVRMQEAMMLEQLGESAKALEASAPLIPIAKRLMLDSDMNLGVFIGNHANMLSRAERFADAEPVYLEAISVFEESGDPIAWEATRICLRFRDMLDRTRQWEDLETLLRRWLAHWERMRPAGDPGRVEAERSLAELLLRQGRIDEARPIIERCVAHAKAWPQGEFLHGRGAIDVSAGMLAVRDGKKEEGRALIERGLAVFKKERSAAFPFIVRVAEEELAALDQPRPTK